MRRGGVTAGRLETVPAVFRRTPRHPAPTTRRLVAALALTSPVVTFTLLSRPQLSVLAAAAAALGLLAVARPAAASLCLVPLGLLGAATSGGPSAALGGIAVVTLLVAVRAVSGAAALRPSHSGVALLGLLLLVSFLFPATAGAAPPAAADLIGLLAGLALLAAVIAIPPSPGGVARVTALAGGLAAAYVLAVGDYADGRLQGLGLNPNYLGALMVLPFVAAAGLARVSRRPAWLAPAAVCLAGMVATESRGAFVATAVGVAVVLVQGRRPRVRALIVATAGAVGGALHGGLGAAEHVAVGGRRATELSTNTAVREHAAHFAADVAAAHPLRGIGYGMFPTYAARSPLLGLYIATHDDYLRLAAEAGVATLAVFLIVLWLGVRGRRSADLAVLRAVAVAYAVGLFFANQLASLVISMPFWLSLGCLLAVAPGRRVSTSHVTRSSTDDRQSDRDPHRRPLRVRQ